MLAAKRLKLSSSSICHRCSLRQQILTLQQRRFRSTSTSRSPEVSQSLDDLFASVSDTQAPPQSSGPSIQYYKTDDDAHRRVPTSIPIPGSNFIRKSFSDGAPTGEALKRWGLDDGSQNSRQDMRFREALMESLKKVQHDVKDAPVLKQLSRDIASNGQGEDGEEEDFGTGVRQRTPWRKEGGAEFNQLWRKFTSNILEGGQNSRGGGEKRLTITKGKKQIENNPVGAELWQDLRDAYRIRGTNGLEDRIKFMFYGHVTGSRFTPSDVRHQKILADLRYPTEWYPATRIIQREIHLHVGPTNSGKTYHALKRLEQAKTGAYAGPLRLLAHEVYTRMNAKGKACALITGEERRAMTDLPTDSDEKEKVGMYSYDMMACTVEMMPLNKSMDVCVIDEIQMIGNSERGWAWTQALLGVKAKEVHLCGEKRTVPLIKELAASMGEKLIVHEYERLSPLMVADSSLNGDLKKLRKGDCIVSFSVMGIHALRKQIEQQTGRKVATVYGSLPPETRAQQARLFNDPDNDYDFLVASDAVGMGLNLAIKRVIFEAANKFDGVKRSTLTVADIKQIGGRAGRFRIASSQEDVAVEDLAAAKGEGKPSEAVEEVVVDPKQASSATEEDPARNELEPESHTQSLSDKSASDSPKDTLSDSSSSNQPRPTPDSPPKDFLAELFNTNKPQPSRPNPKSTPTEIYGMPPTGDVPDGIGIITTLEKFDYPIVRAAMSAEPEPILTAGLFPPGPVLERFSSYFPPGTPFSYILTRLHELSQMHARFHLCGLKDQVWIADLIEPVPGLTIADRNIICSSPATKSDTELWSQLMPEYARAIANQSGGGFLDIKALPLEVLDEPLSVKRTYLRGLERLHKGIVSYLWLGYRFHGIFTGRRIATHVKGLVEEKIEAVLKMFSFSERERRKVVEERERKFLEGLEFFGEGAGTASVRKEGVGEGEAAPVPETGEREESPDVFEGVISGHELDGKEEEVELDRQSGMMASGERFGGEAEDVIFEEDERLVESDAEAEKKKGAA